MSAFIVEKEHIDFLVSAVLHLCGRDGFYFGSGNGAVRLSTETATGIGQMLWRENHRSVNYRYEGDTLDATPAYSFTEVRWEASWQQGGLARLAKALDCYEYQSCESPDWRESDSYAFCASARKAILRKSPGYDDAPWGVKASDVEPETRISLASLARRSR